MLRAWPAESDPAAPVTLWVSATSPTVIAALNENSQALANESADLLYHLLVLWATRGLDPEQVWEALAERQGISGLAEKASRKEK